MSIENQEDYLQITISPKEDIKPEFPYLKNIILMSSTIQMWPNTGKKNSFLYHLGVWLVITTVLWPHVLCFFIKAFIDYKNMDSITDLIDFGTVSTSAGFRYMYIYFRGEKYLSLVSQIHNNFIHYSLFVTKNRPSIIPHYKFANKLTFGYIIFTFSWVFQLISGPAITYAWKNYKLSFGLNETQTEPIPYPVIVKGYAPFDYFTQPGNTVFYLFQFLGFPVFAVVYMAVDCFWYMVIILTVGQFALLKASINTIGEVLKESESTEGCVLLKKNQTQKLEEGLKCCIRHHQFMREFVRFVDDLSCPNVLVDFLHILISVAFLLVDITIGLNSGDWNRIMVPSQYIISSLVHSFFFNWLGNELIVKEEELAEALYDLPWYRCPKQKKMLLVMMKLSRRPQSLTGGKMYKLTLGFFTDMVKSIFSYFTFLMELR